MRFRTPQSDDTEVPVHPCFVTSLQAVLPGQRTHVPIQSDAPGSLCSPTVSPYKEPISAGNFTNLDHKLVVPQVALDQEVGALSDGVHDLGCLVGALIPLQTATHDCRQCSSTALSDCTVLQPCVRLQVSMVAVPLPLLRPSAGSASLSRSSEVLWNEAQVYALL